MGYHEIMPQSFRDHDIDLWLPCPRHARMLLDELVTHELTVLRAREEWLRTHIEEPARALAQERARLLEGRDLALLRNEQIHDQLFHRAYQALRRGRRRAGPVPAPRGANIDGPAPPVTRAAVLTSRPPRTHCETHTVFFDYHASRRAFLDEDYTQCTPDDEATGEPSA
jgi:hypothetical protein